MRKNQNRKNPIVSKIASKIMALWLKLFSTQAKLLNDELFFDIDSVTDQEWDLFGKKVKSYCEIREFMPDYTENWLQHKYRLYLSIKWLEDIIRENDIRHGLDLGWETPATDLWREYFPGVSWKISPGDLRYPWEIPNESVDLIVCTEVLEHLSDIPYGINESFQKTGLRTALKECYRVLKPQGWVFITTPNVTSMVQLQRVLWGLPPWFFLLHIREYDPKELLQELQESGFSIQRWRTIHCLTAEDRKDFTWIYQYLLASGYPVIDRGDDIFVLAQKNLV